MIKIKLIAEYTSEKEINEVIGKYKIYDNLLYKNTLKICRLNYKCKICNNKLFVCYTNKVEEYEIKKYKLHKSKRESKFVQILFSKIDENKSKKKYVFDIPKKADSLPIFSNCEEFRNLSDFHVSLQINNMTIYKSDKNYTTTFFYQNGRIHFLYKCYLVTLLSNDVIYSYKIVGKDDIEDIYCKSINNRPKSIYKMYLGLNLYENLNINIYNLETIKFIYELCIYNIDIVRNINFNFFNNTDLIDLYRKIDKKYLLDKYIRNISFDNLDFTDMKKIVLCNDNFTISYIDRCIKDNKEWEIEKIQKIYKDREEIINFLKSKNCLYLLGKFTNTPNNDIMKIERCVMKSNKNRYKIDKNTLSLKLYRN